MTLIIFIPFLFVLCLIAFKLGEVRYFYKMTKIIDEAYDRSKTVEDLEKRLGWIDCILYIMEEEE